MDRGAARSRKRTAQLDSGVGNPSSSAKVASSTVRNGPSESSNARPPKYGLSGPSSSRVSKFKKAPREPQSRDPELYRSKAVRSSAALIWSQAPFPIPPPKDILKGITRVDLSGSQVTDVSLLKDTSVRWLSLAGCSITVGWEAVGSLKDLTVLNISQCGLSPLPPSLKNLGELKALVAMRNPWSSLDPDVVGSWTDLNSLIISHSPNLTSLPSTLSSLYHLSKLTYSHCPRLSSASLPDLSSLPLLRDVKMNNLPLITSLPSHISKWGTGDMLLVDKHIDGPSKSTGTTRHGQGLEVLDFGNCSISFSNLASIFNLGKSTSTTTSSTFSPTPRWPNLRSLTLHSNPLCTKHEDYAESLQLSSELPHLQIIDSKRVKERKLKGVVSETKMERRKREKKEAKMKPSGANVTTSSSNRREWGGEGKSNEKMPNVSSDSKVSKASKALRASKSDTTSEDPGRDRLEKKRKRAGHHTQPALENTFNTVETGNRDNIVTTQMPHTPHKRPRTSAPPPTDLSVPPAKPARPLQAAQSHTSTQAYSKHQPPSIDTPRAKGKPSRSETSVVGVIDIVDHSTSKHTKKGKSGESKFSGETGANGGKNETLDLKAMFGKTTEQGSGLGVGGW